MMKMVYTKMVAVLLLCGCILFGCADNGSGGSNDAEQTPLPSGGNAGTSEKIVLHAYNYINVYTWGTDNEALNAVHSPLSNEGQGWYGITLDTGYACIIFTKEYNYWTDQTDNLDRTSGEWWYKDGQWYSSKPNSESIPSGNTGGNSGESGGGSDGSGSSSEKASGLYIGIIKFADDVIDLNDGKFVHLNSMSAKDNIKNLIEYNYYTAEDMATLMYYGVHTALVNLKNNESSLPDDLKNVYIITFTDGLDNSSASMAKDHPLENNTGLSGKFTTDQYAEWLKEQLLTHKVKGNDIVCHSIGVKGSDMRDENGFKDALNYVATSSNDAHVLTDFDKVQSTFEELAKNLTITTYTYNFDLILPSNAWESDVCMTFDIQDYQNIESAQIKFYGKITPSDVDDKEYTFEINEYSGIKPSSMKIIGGEIPSTKNPKLSKLQFLFENIGCEESYESSFIPVWLSNSLAWSKTKNGKWNLNSEYNPEESNQENTSRSSAVIYLVLDNSFSLSTDISKVRNAVLNFIDTLYEKLPKNTE
ncbi:MAG: hypothetical protein HDR34_08390 [Treponema sp.]|nr:hypothetical protein [Treponema sp.]MBD5443398.1 hypothetical protein [Treponema sp.]